ncbi:MAG: DUF3575 domain-containing protein [Paramuribaculum sp.]|nr:DUF3575 domain-containing protein [Paramuribaculum sp.]
MNNTNPIRRLATMLLLLMLVSPLSAKEKADSVRIFRFYVGSDKFYAPGLNNGEELAKLFDFVQQYKDMILGHDMMLYVDGYCASKGSEVDNLRIARTRSNRVKSELITRKGLKEDCFVTRKHAGQGDSVTVRVKIPETLIRPMQQQSEVVKDDTFDQKSEAIQSQEQPTEETVVTEAVESVEPVQMAPEEGLMPTAKADSRFLLKTNLLYYAILMPNLEVEWKFADRWSAALEFQGAWYAKNDPHKVYRVATVMPEVRYWIMERSRWNGMYVGAFVGAGLYDLCDGKKGHEGEGGLVGISAGYMWAIGKHLSLDAGIGLGYLYARDKLYYPRDGHYLYQLTKNVNYFGPLRLKLSLVWRFQTEK